MASALERGGGGEEWRLVGVLVGSGEEGFTRDSCPGLRTRVRSSW